MKTVRKCRILCKRGEKCNKNLIKEEKALSVTWQKSAENIAIAIEKINYYYIYQDDYLQYVEIKRKIKLRVYPNIFGRKD